MLKVMANLLRGVVRLQREIAQPRGESQGEGCGGIHRAPPARKSSGAREKASRRPRKATSAARQAKTPQRVRVEAERSARDWKRWSARVVRDVVMMWNMETSQVFSVIRLPKRRKKGRESKTACDGGHIPPRGFCISPLPAMNSRNMPHFFCART